MDIILASGNRHKQQEVQAVLATARVLLPEDIGIVFEFDETGETFRENSLGKARHLSSLVDSPVLADDSGLVVPALGGAPGVRSARYGDSPSGPPLTDRDRYELLLRNLEGITERHAMFVCSMVFFVDEYRFFLAQETFEGEIAHAPAGGGGFGYDPVFFIPQEGKTAAELSPERKNEISHRGKALSRLTLLLADELAIPDLNH